MAQLTRSRSGAGSAGFSEASQIMPEGQGYISTPGIHSAEQIEGWKCVTGAVHASGGRMMLQLWHVGRISHQSFQPGGGGEQGYTDYPTLRKVDPHACYHDADRHWG